MEVKVEIIMFHHYQFIKMLYQEDQVEVEHQVVVEVLLLLVQVMQEVLHHQKEILEVQEHLAQEVVVEVVVEQLALELMHLEVLVEQVEQVLLLGLEIVQ